MKPFLNNCRFHPVQTSKYKVLDVSPLCQDLEKDQKCHHQIWGICLECSGTSKLKPDMSWKLLEHQHQCPTWGQFYITMDWDANSAPKLTPSGSTKICSSPHGTNAFWRKVSWSYETKTELSSHNDTRHGDCFAASGTGALRRVNGIMNEDDYLQILQLHLKSTSSWLKHNWVFQQDETHIKTGFGKDKWADMKLLEWSSQTSTILKICEQNFKARSVSANQPT